MTDVQPWMKRVIDSKDDPLISPNEILATINFRTGVALGLAMKVDELEEQLQMAFAYQREIDARLVEEGLSPLRDMSSTKANSRLRAAAAKIRRER